MIDISLISSMASRKNSAVGLVVISSEIEDGVNLENELYFHESSLDLALEPLGH